jgi:hypothetical protein
MTPSLVPWNCPACQQSIQHREVEIRPLHGVIYRCHICRLELELEPATGGLAIVPLDEDEPAPRLRGAV